MNVFKVYSHKPESLRTFGEIWGSKMVKMSYVVLTTKLEKHEVWNIKDVYDVVEVVEGEYYTNKNYEPLGVDTSG